MPSCRQPGRSSTCPPWLQTALAEIEQRVEALAVSAAEEEPDSFAERAENYYQKRPQLITLLQDLHNRYLYLADRYSLSLLKPHRCKVSVVPSDTDDEDRLADHEPPPESFCSDAESSLSFQAPPQQEQDGGAELIVAELVSLSVEREILLHELGEADGRRSESARKIDLQRSLLEVLESERLVLLGENARLEFRAAAAEEEARGLAAEAGYMRRKATELARLVVKLREDHRVYLLGRKIESLQAQIYGLERRNRECYEAMARREVEKGEIRIELDRLRAENRRLRKEAEAASKGRRRGKGGERGPRWWARVKRMEWTPCGPHADASECCFQW